jgi:outer membrane protein
MTKHFTGAFVGVSLFVLGAMFAAVLPQSAHAEELKIGVVIPQMLLARSEVGKAAAERLKAKKEDAQAKLDDITGELKELQDDLMKRAMMLSDEEKQKAGEDMERRQREAARTKEDLERGLQKTEQEVLAEVNEFLSGAMAEFGEQNGYDFILDAQAAVYFSKGTDITERVVEFVNEDYKPKKK